MRQVLEGEIQEVVMSEGSYIGLHRKEAKMTDEIIVKICCDTSDIVSATQAMNELAAAADKVREVLGKLFGAPGSIVTNVMVSGSLEAQEHIRQQIDESIAASGQGIRPKGKRFKL